MIQFSINGMLIKEDNIDPNLTVLRYLRASGLHNATKEGCAGGDCGACSILVAQQDSTGVVSFQAINACLALLGSVDGKNLITVEGLRDGQNLHPTQQAMIDHHGSQCGFCTPGIVASLAALYHNKQGAAATEHEIHEALSGNLCRCTGYRPIIDAAKAMTEYPIPSQGAAISASPISIPSAIEFDPSASKDCISASMNADGRMLFVPESEDQLKTLLGKFPNATLWAGGTDLGLEVTQQFKQFDTIISLHKVSALTAVLVTDSEIRFGAMVTYTDAEPYFTELFPAFAQLTNRIAARQIRNLGTLGGNVANASPIGDTPPVFLAMNARIELSSKDGIRDVAIDDFFKGYKQTAMKAGEYLSAIIVPKLADHQSLHIFKISKRKEDDISAVLMAVRLDNNNGVIANARLACGGMAATPLRASKTEAVLNGAPFELNSFELAAEQIKHDYSPIEDVRATPEYRLNVARNLVIKTGLGLFSPELLSHSSHADSSNQKGGH